MGFLFYNNLWSTATASIKRKFEIEFAVCFTPSYLFLNIDFQYAPGDNIFLKASIQLLQINGSYL